jgi:hypothetical protein
MNKKIFLIILKLNLLSFVFSTLMAWSNYDSVSGFENRQTHFMLFTVNLLFSLLNFLLSLSGLLNTQASIRESNFNSVLAFIGMPSIVFVCIIIQGYFDDVQYFMDSLPLSYPSLFYIIGYVLFHNRIQASLDEYNHK